MAGITRQQIFDISKWRRSAGRNLPSTSLSHIERGVNWYDSILIYEKEQKLYHTISELEQLQNEKHDAIEYINEYMKELTPYQIVYVNDKYARRSVWRFINNNNNKS